MNKEAGYSSDSDQSDEDFCLENADAEAVSEEDSDSDDASSEDEEDASVKPKKVVKGNKNEKANSPSGIENKHAGTGRSTRQSEAQQNEGTKNANEKEELESDEEVDKSRSDALWADFLSDVGDTGKSDGNTSEHPKEKLSVQINNGVESTATTKTTTTTTKQVTEVLDFAGEQVTVQKAISSKENQKISPEQREIAENCLKSPPLSRAFGAAKRPANSTAAVGGGLGSLLNQLGKKKKMSVLEKSQLDWKSFKSDEGIDEELQTHNKGKDGYLERQDFLERTDLRQFQIEKNLRQSRRQN